LAASLRVVLNEIDGRSMPIDVHFDQVVLVGYSGRDRGAVEAHIRELQHLGVARPSRVPALYTVAPSLVSVDESLVVAHAETSGEAEFVLLHSESGVLVGVGSDHTDRAHEAIDVAESKMRCGKLLSRDVWLLRTLEPHWDRLELRAWTTDQHSRRLYQEGLLGTLLTPSQLLAEVQGAGLATGQALIFSGTLPTIGGFAFGGRFEVELYDPVLDRRLACAYSVTVRASAPGPPSAR
jgi:hypothetical protein